MISLLNLNHLMYMHESSPSGGLYRTCSWRLQRRSWERSSPAMSKTDTVQLQPRRAGCFLVCFGAAQHDHEPDLAKQCGKKRRWWSWPAGYSWSRFQKKAAAARMIVVPVDASGDPWCSDRGRKTKWGSVKFHEPKKPPTAPAAAAAPLTNDDTGNKPAGKSIGGKPSSPKDRRTASAPTAPPSQLEPRRLNSAGRLGSIVGLSVVVVALAMVLLLGRVCAILCTSAWLYIMPRLRPQDRPSQVVTEKVIAVDTINAESVQYKKKVVLEGLLDRSRPNNFTTVL